MQYGVNITTPVSKLRPGTAWVAINWELPPLGGYRTLMGYERYDGQPSPSLGADAEEIATRRTAIQRVPGSGPVRGVFVLKGIRYAFRNTADGLNKRLYKATSTGWELVTTPTLNPGGYFNWTIANFNGAAAAKALYGCDGVNPAFEFDGTTFTQIVTGAEPLYPQHIEEHKLHLFLSYAGGSVQFSSPGLPLNYVVADGAGELAAGDDVFNLVKIKGGVLGVFCRDRIKILTGSSVLDFDFRDYSETGVRENTVQPLFTDAIYIDKQIQMMSSSQKFGDFQSASLSEPIRPLIDASAGQSEFSLVLPSKNQYILFQGGRRAVITSFNDRKLSGFTTAQFQHQFVCGGVFDDDDGREVCYLGTDDGYVMQFNTGTSFDGLDIEVNLQLAPNHLGNFQINKRFRSITAELDSNVIDQLYVSAEYDYGDSPRNIETLLQNILSGSLFDVAVWDEAVWSGTLKNYAQVYIAGHGRNISILFYGKSATNQPYTIEQVTLGYDLRGQIR
jgi:hypothetical protein